MSDNTELVTKLTEMKNSMVSLVNIGEKIQNMDAELNVPEKEIPGKAVFIMWFIIFGVYCTVFKDFADKHGFIDLLMMIVSLVLSVTLLDKIINYNPKESERPKIESDIYNLETEWNQIAVKTYNNDILPPRYLKPEYLEYILECFKYKRVSNLNEALNLLDQEIRHDEMIEMIEKVENNNQMIYNAIQNIGDKIDESNENLRVIRKDISWTAYNTSALRSRSYVGKAIDDVVRN